MESFNAVVRDALAYYGLAEAQVCLLKSTNNHVYHVDAEQGRFVLRVHRPGYRRLEWIQSELMWLSAIRRDTDLCVPEPAAPVYASRVGGQAVYCTLLHWLHGEPMPPAEITPEQAYRIGVFIGKLHQYSAKFEAPAGFALPRLDWAGMFGDKSPYRSEDGFFTADQRRTLASIGDRVRIVMQELEEIQPTLTIIHGDLIWKNFLIHQNTICAIDFDNCSFGYALYDLAPTLLGYKDEPHYPQTRETILNGHTSVYPSTAQHHQQIETFIAGRHALSCYWIAANRDNPAISHQATEIVSSRIRELQRYLDTGNFTRGEIVI